MTATVPAPLSTAEPRATAPSHHHHSFGFWAATAAFLVTMGFSAVPTPLYAMYRERDHFSTFMVTVVYAVYAVGVIASLFLGGHLSDRLGRKVVLVPTLLLNVSSAVVFVLAPSLAGLLVARTISGISVGLTTATATAYLAELHGRTRSQSPHRPAVVATAANLGGIGFGPLVSGLLAEYAPSPLRVPYLVFGVALLVLALLIAVSPETTPRAEPMPAYRPQRVAVPPRARATFFAATAAGFGSFALFGVFNSLAPTFLSGSLHSHSPATAGAVAFAAFAAAAVAQIAARRLAVTPALAIGVVVIVPALTCLVLGMWLADLAAFVIGGIATGVGAGLVFKGAAMSAGLVAPEGSRAEVIAGFFLGAYVGLSVPVVGLGIATQYVPAKDAMLVFAAIMLAIMVVAARALAQAQRVGRAQR